MAKPKTEKTVESDSLLGKSIKSLISEKFVSTDEDFESFSAVKNTILVIFFYPKDNTTGCTTESQNFRDHLSDFEKLGARVVGVSPDSLKSHLKFITQHSLNFPLISDADKVMCELFEVWKQKSMYGRKYMGVERSTFVIDDKGKIVKVWRKVSVPGHVTEVLSFVETL